MSDPTDRNPARDSEDQLTVQPRDGSHVSGTEHGATLGPPEASGNYSDAAAAVVVVTASDGSSGKTDHGAAPSDPTAHHPSAQGVAETPVAHKKPTSERHVAFSPHVQIAEMVLERPTDSADQAAELDVYERLYRRKKQESVAAAAKHAEQSATPSARAPTGRDEGAVAGAAAETEAGPSSADATVAPHTSKSGSGVPRSPPKGGREADDEVECTFHPQITKFAEERRTTNWKQFVRLQTDWVRQTKRKLAEAEKKVKMEEGIDQPLYDDMDKERKTSKKIIEFLEKQHLYHPPHVAWRRPATPNRMLSARTECDRGNDDDQSSRRSSKKKEQVMRADPAVFDKLYQEATIREAALRVMEQTQIEKEARELFRPSTNESYWHSGTILGARSPSRHFSSYDPLGSSQQQDQSVVDELLAKGEEYKLRREQRIREKHNNPEVYTFKPSTNENSRRIILQRAMERELERQDALLSACAPPPPRDSSVSIGGEDVTLAQKQKARFDAEVFTARMQRREAEKAQKLAALRRSLKLEEVAECTFRPSISKKSHDSVERQRSALVNTPSRSFPAAPGLDTGKSSASESFSPDYRTRPAQPQPHPRTATAAAPRSSSGVASASAARNRSEASAVRAGAHDQSDEYLRGLEDELRGVIAEWTTITSDAMKPLR